jgi:cytochrome P450
LDTVLKQEKNSGESALLGDTIATARTLADLPGPKGIPFLGNVFQMESNRFHQSLEKWAKKFGPLYKIQIGRKPLLIISDADMIGALLRDRPDAIRRSSRTASAINDLGVSGVFSDEGDEWRKQRKLVMRALTPEVIRSFFPQMIALTERLRLRWQASVAAGQPVDILRDLKAYALDVTIGLAMGQDINALEHDHNPLQSDIEFIFNRMARRLTSPFAYWHHFKLPVDRAADKSVERIRQAVTGFIAQARKQIEDHPERRTKPTNMMEALIVARDEPGSEFTDNHVIGNAMTMVFAGEDTTSNTIAWLLNFVARDLDVAARLATESDAALDGNPILKAFDKLDQFHFTEAATNEAMRLKPVAPLLGFETNKDVKIGDTLIPKGTVMLACMRYAALQEENFAQHAAFLPDRWMSDQSTGTNADPARKLFPFGGGPRFCPGRFLAMAEIKMVMAMVARNFTMSVDEPAPPVEELFTFTMTPSVLPIRLTQRKPI